MRTPDPRVVLGLHQSRHERPLLTGAADLGITTIDTSSNYLGFRSHETLAKTAGDLLPRFTISTKVGYFQAGEVSEHSLDPDRLWRAVEDAARDLGREPDIVFLHNPEHSLTGLSQERALDQLANACLALAEASERGLCQSWGISSWDPRPLATLVGNPIPAPDVLMIRAGLLVGTDALDAAELVTARWKPSAIWGMSPFGGSRAEPVWDRFEPRVFLQEPKQCTPAQAAFRAAFHLPSVDAVAVGTNTLDHLRELIASLNSEVNKETVSHYRKLLRDRRQEP